MVALQVKWGIAKIRLHSLWVITVWERNYMSVHLTRKLCWYNKRLVGQIFPRDLLQLLPERRVVVADAKRPSGSSSSRSKISVQRAKGGPVQCSAASTLLQLLPNMSWTRRQLNYCRLRGVDPHRFQPAKCSSQHQQNTVHWSKKDGVIGKEQMSPVCHRFEPTPHPTSTSESNAAKRKHKKTPQSDSVDCPCLHAKETMLTWSIEGPNGLHQQCWQSILPQDVSGCTVKTFSRYTKAHVDIATTQWALSFSRTESMKV